MKKETKKLIRILLLITVLLCVIFVILVSKHTHWKKEKASLEQLVSDFIILKEQDFQSKTHLNMDHFFVPEMRNTLQDEIFWKVFRFEKLIRMRQSLLWETFDFDIQEIHIRGNTATVQAFESYEYEIENSNGMSSGRGTTLYFTCQKIENEWFILSIDTDNQLIEDHVFSYSAEELPALAGYTETESDIWALECLVADFIALKEQDFQSETHLNMDQFFVPKTRESLETETFWKVFRFEKLIRMQQSLLWETFDFEIQDIIIEGKTAKIQAFEVYEYQLEQSNGMSSGRGTTLYFTCQKIENEWFILSIDTDNQLIEDHVSSYSADELPALAGYSD